MSDISAKPPAVENPLFLTVFRVAIPTILGAILSYAIGIRSAQEDQGKQLSLVQGQLGVIAAQSTDYVSRLSKLEGQVDDNRRSLGVLTGRVLVLEAKHH